MTVYNSKVQKKVGVLFITSKFNHLLLYLIYSHMWEENKIININLWTNVKNRELSRWNREGEWSRRPSEVSTFLKNGRNTSETNLIRKTRKLRPKPPYKKGLPDEAWRWDGLAGVASRGFPWWLIMETSSSGERRSAHPYKHSITNVMSATMVELKLAMWKNNERPRGKF